MIRYIGLFTASLISISWGVTPSYAHIENVKNSFVGGAQALILSSEVSLTKKMTNIQNAKTPIELAGRTAGKRLRVRYKR